MRLIDCHKAKRAIYQHKTQRLQKETVLKILDAVPTIDAVPVVRGKWENPSFIDPEDNLDPRMKCSECGEVDTPLARWNYCPKCGARMDGDINETD